MINKRIFDLSCNEEEFNKAKPLYEKALKESGYTTSLEYKSPHKSNSRNRNRKIIWFNPPFSQNVKTNIGKVFIKLIKKHFPKHHKLHKIFNTNTIKLSYSCMPNMSSMIKQHNLKVFSSSSSTQKRSCNCRNPTTCPLDGKCLTENIVYKAVVSTEIESHTYYGSSEDFKLRYNNHTKAFRNQHYINDTELSKHIWKLKNTNTPYNITWSIAAYASAYRIGTRKCDLCITEKYIIARAEQKNLLNKRTEIISKCRHRNKYLLKNIK